jgi:class 3 adenylate cyclase/pSer/pThr/pTyr-binding forkhead associated (FHA) protein
VIELRVVMFTDQVDFTNRTSLRTPFEIERVAREQEEITAAVVRECNGMLLKDTGDGSFIQFLSCRDAVRCGFQLQQRVAERNADQPNENLRFELHIGIDFGEVVVLPNGDLRGNAPNIAARVCAQCGAGQVFFTEKVMKELHSREAPSEPVGKVRLKGVEDETAIYRLVGWLGDAEPGSSHETMGLLEFTDGPKKGGIYKLSESRRMIIGRDPASDISFDERNLSRKHATLERSLDGFVVTNHSRHVGTFVNDRQVHERLVLRDGDVLNFGGRTRLRLRTPFNPLTPRTEAEAHAMNAGAVRWTLDPDANLFALADGSRCNRGDAASAAVLQKLAEFIADSRWDVTWPYAINEEFTLEVNRLTCAIKFGFQHLLESKDSDGVGLAIGVLFIRDNLIHLGTIGGVRCYFVRDDEIQELEPDESRHERDKKPSRLDKTPDVRVLARDARAGDLVLLLTPAVHAVIGEREISRVLKSPPASLAAAAAELVQTARSGVEQENAAAAVLVRLI